jgi:hypothetical protein
MRAGRSLSSRKSHAIQSVSGARPRLASEGVASMAYLWKDHPSEYRAWNAMKSRCFNKQAPSYRRYGLRGITVYQEWRDSFAAVLRDMGPRPSFNHSIDRIDNDGNYEPSNCGWPYAGQSQHRSCVRWLTHDGETMCISDWARRLGIHEASLRCRLKRMTPSQAITYPTNHEQQRRRTIGHIRMAAESANRARAVFRDCQP